MKFALALLLLAAPAAASTTASYAALDARAATACAKASGFTDARVDPAPVRFSDTVGIDIRMVSGVYPQRHMRGAKGHMLCAYNRRTGRAEAAELGSWRR